MSWIDSIIGAISPKAACEREAWRQQLEEMKSYDGANYGRLNANWRMTNQSAEMTDRFSRDTLRARARDLERNSDIMNGLISAYKRNVVGKGYTLQARTSKPKLNAQLEKLWKEWVKAKNCDVTGQQSFNQILRMMVERKIIDGGVLVHKCYTNGGVLPFKLQILEVDELCSTWSAPHAQGNRVVNGIEYNSYNKPVGYWIQHYDIDGVQQVTADYYDARDIIFYYSKKRPSQIREISDVSPAITRIRDANEFMTAVSVKERIAACLAVFIKKVNPSAGGFGRSAAGGGNSVNYSGKMLTPGMISELSAGDEIQVVDPSAGGAEATDYLKLQQRLIGAGQGLSYESTSRDMSQVNYSSARQGAIEDELTYSEEMELLQNVMTEIYETFVISAMLAEKVKLPSFFENEDKRLDYLEHEWVASPKRWIDPQKEASAQMIAMKYGIKTFKQVAAEQGHDWQEQIDDIAEIQEYAAGKGLDMNMLLFGQAASPEKPEEAETDDIGAGADIISEGVPEGVSDEQAEKMAGDIQAELPRINGEQAKAVVTIILQYVNDRLSLRQAVNIVSLITGIDRDSAREIIEDKAEEAPAAADGADNSGDGTDKGDEDDKDDENGGEE